jgi:hypothetical protein
VPNAKIFMPVTNPYPTPKNILTRHNSAAIYAVPGETWLGPIIVPPIMSSEMEKPYSVGDRSRVRLSVVMRLCL